MAEKDKFKAVWVSHSSLSDFLKCPRYYFLRNVYKDPITGRKITRMEPALALGQVVHSVIEGLSILPVNERLKNPLGKQLEKEWKKVAGKKGGFESKDEEEKAKGEGQEMLSRVEKNPGPVSRKAVKIAGDLPWYWLSEDDEIILCGKIDWLEYVPEGDMVRIVDFKTGKYEEDEESLQLPIYLLLANNTQPRGVKGASYWYLRRDSEPKEQKLPDLEKAKVEILDLAKRVKLARQLEHFVCPKGGCRYCMPLEEIVKGKGEKVGVSEYNQDIYIL